MKFDKDTVREILLAIEASGQDPREWIDLEIAGKSSEEVAYHVQLLAEAGFIDAQELSSSDGYDWKAKRLTYQGHEFLDTIREPEIWRMTKDNAKKAGGAGLQMIFEIGKACIKQQLINHGISVG